MFSYFRPLILFSFLFFTSCASLGMHRAHYKTENIADLLESPNAAQLVLKHLKSKKLPGIKASFKVVARKNSIRYRFKSVYFYGGEIGEKIVAYDTFGRTLFNLIHNGERFSAETPEENVRGEMSNFSSDYFPLPLVYNFRTIVTKELPVDVIKVLVEQNKDGHILYLFKTEEDLKEIVWLGRDGTIRKKEVYQNNKKITVHYAGSGDSSFIEISSDSGGLILREIKLVVPYDFTEKLLKSFKKI